MIINNGKTNIRYDSIANWNKYNPILEKGEPVISIESNGNLKMKVGDGVNPFQKLKYLSSAEIGGGTGFYPTRYNSLAEIGLTPQTASLQAIANKLKNGNSIEYYNNNNNQGTFYPTSYGTFKAECIGTMVYFTYLGMAGTPTRNDYAECSYHCATFVNGTIPIREWRRNITYVFNNKYDFDSAVDYIISQKLTNNVSYEVYASGKVVIYGTCDVMNGEYTDITPPISLKRVYYATMNDAIWTTRTTISTVEQFQWNIGDDRNGLINGKVRFIHTKKLTPQGVCFHIIGQRA